LLIMQQYQSQDIDHLSISSGALEQDKLELLEALRECIEGGVIPPFIAVLKSRA